MQRRVVADSEMLDLMMRMYTEMQKGFSQIDERLDILGKTVLRIEKEHGEKLSAIFDDREVIHEKLDNIQMDINILTAKPANHDNKIIELSRKIK